jgi:hypothetical protein
VVCLSVLVGYLRTSGVANEAFQYYASFHLESSLSGFGFSLPCFFSDDSLDACSWLISWSCSDAIPCSFFQRRRTHEVSVSFWSYGNWVCACTTVGLVFVMLSVMAVRSDCNTMQDLGMEVIVMQSRSNSYGFCG